MTPQQLASRIAALDWSACSLQHQLAVNAAVTTLDPSRKIPERMGVLAAGPTSWPSTPAGPLAPSASYASMGLNWPPTLSPAVAPRRRGARARETVAALAACAVEAVGAAEAESGDFVTVDGIPYCRVAIV